MVSGVFILAQLVGFLSLILYCISMQVNNRMRLLVLLVFVNFLNGVVYFLLGSHAGGLISMVSVTRLIIFSVYERKQKRCPLAVLIAFIALDLAVGLYTYNFWYDVLCIAEAIIVAYGTYIKNMTITRICHLFSCILMFTFNIFVLAYSNMLSESIGMIFTLLGILRLDILPKISPEVYASSKILSAIANSKENKKFANKLVNNKYSRIFINNKFVKKIKNNIRIASKFFASKLKFVNRIINKLKNKNNKLSKKVDKISAPQNNCKWAKNLSNDSELQNNNKCVKKFNNNAFLTDKTTINYTDSANFDASIPQIKNIKR